MTTATSILYTLPVLRDGNGCHNAREWLEGYTDPQRAWDECERGDWMLWWAAQFAGEPGCDARRPLVLAACDCAELARPYWHQADAPLLAACLATAQSWARDEGATLEGVRDAAYAAYAAAAADAATLARCADIVRGYYPTPPGVEAA